MPDEVDHPHLGRRVYHLSFTRTYLAIAVGLGEVLWVRC